MKNGGNIDNIELIPITDVDELYETPQGVCSESALLCDLHIRTKS